MAAKKKFFDERSDESEVKARIINKYFNTWATIVPAAAQRFGQQKVMYMDLYAGPGRYRDGAASTPLLVLEKAIADPRLSQMLEALFNDADGDHSSTLQTEIAKIKGIETLKYPPKVYCSQIGKDTEEMFSKVKLQPSFTFLDPFGYKGLSLKLVNAVVKDWGCDCVFFFNYNRINAGISNTVVEEHMNSLFGEARADTLREQIKGKGPEKRELLILENMSQALKEMGGRYVLPFRFKKEGRTSHYLIFVTKAKVGYKIMKEIMAGESSTRDEGVPSFAYSPAEADTPLLFSLSQPIAALQQSLLNAFGGKTMNINEICEAHNVDTPYILPNYRDALRQLEELGVIHTEPAAADRPKRQGVVTFSDKVKVTFF